MKPHPLFEDWTIPSVHELGPFTLRVLTAEDVERDYAAVMESAADIKSNNPASTWPKGLTLHDNLLDLAWHQREFESRRSFTYVIEDAAGAHLGCLYIYPSLAGERAAEVTWWWRTGAVVDRGLFRETLTAWLVGPDWPELRYDFTPHA